jgi:hypothetical protein
LTRPPVKLVARNQLNQVIRALDALADLTTNAFGKSAVFHVIPDERCQASSHRHDPQQPKDTPAGAEQELGMSPPKQATLMRASSARGVMSCAPIRPSAPSAGCA